MSAASALHAVNLHGKDDFKATPEEMKLIADKMKDPEFMKLFAEYTQSLSDPKYREEEETYLKQVEEEAREGGDYTFEFVFPKPNFVVELLQKDPQFKSGRVFVNICTSEKVDPYEEQTTGDRHGSNWHVPVSVSDSRAEEFEEIAVENINSGYKRTFGFEFRRLPSSVKSVGAPKNQTVRRKAGQSAFQKDTHNPISLGPIKVAAESPAEQRSGTSTRGNPSVTAANSSSTAKVATAGATATPASTTPQAASPGRSRENLPKVTIAHRGEVDLTDAWNWKTSDKRIGVPKELVVKFEFIGVKSASILDVDVEATHINVAASSEHPYCGILPLPFTVLSTPVSAKFDKNKAVLTLVLTVVPPPAPPSAVPPTSQTTATVSGSESASIATDKAEVAATAEPTPIPAAKPVTSSGNSKSAEEHPTERLAPARPSESLHAPPPTTTEVVPNPPPCATSTIQVQVEQEKPADAPAPSHRLSGLDHLDEDRAAQFREALAKARREREEFEANEKNFSDRNEAPMPTEGSSAVDPKTVAKESHVAAAKEEPAELIDLTRRQQEWREAVAQTTREEELRAALEAQEAEWQQQLEREEREKEAAREARRVARDQAKKIEAEKTAERLAALLEAQRAKLPLHSHHIFSID